MEPDERRNASRGAFTRGQVPGAIERDNDSKKDIVKRIPHLYRVLDLISEQGSGGLGKLTLQLPILCPLRVRKSRQNHHRWGRIERPDQWTPPWCLRHADESRF